ncbi:MAG: hypothetical protein ACR2HQ_04205 [Ilumatobacteraceae bacterium]
MAAEGVRLGRLLVQLMSDPVEACGLLALMLLQHATALEAAETDWLRIVILFDELMAIHPSPIVALNRAVAVGMSDGSLAGLRAEPVVSLLPDLHLVPAARGELLARAGRAAEARAELDRAITLAPSEQERRQLGRRRAAT